MSFSPWSSKCLTWLLKIRGAQSGFGIAEVLVGSMVATVLLLGISKIAGQNFKSARKLNASAELRGLKSKLADQMDCRRTLSPVGAPCAAGTYVDLLEGDGSILVSSGGTAFGRWTIRALCTSTGLDIRAAALTPLGSGQIQAREFGASNPDWFLRDEVAGNLSYDWSHGKSRLHAPTSSGLCASMFSGASSVMECGTNEFVAGVNFAAKSLRCQPIPQCSVNEALSWNGTGFSCVPARTDGYITTQIINPEIDTLFGRYNTIEPLCYSGRKVPRVAFDGPSHIFEVVTLDRRNEGLRCRHPYMRTDCAILYNANPVSTPNRDWDLWAVNNGCVTDDEEWDSGGAVIIQCCRNPDL
jgi:hypothetical protein